MSFIKVIPLSQHMASYNSLTDLQLIHLLKEDDQHAFAEIYSRYSESLAGFTASKLYSMDAARDVIHDLFVKLWEDRKQLNITLKLKAYLFTITRHRIIDEIRKNITRNEYAAMLRSFTNAYEPNAEQQLAMKELQQIVENSVDQLTPKVKEIYKLSREENLSIPEIAEKLQLSEQTVKNQLSTSLSHLRKSLSKISVLMISLWWMS